MDLNKPTMMADHPRSVYDSVRLPASNAIALQNSANGDRVLEKELDENCAAWCAHEYVVVKEEHLVLQSDGTYAMQLVNCIKTEPGRFVYDNVEDFIDIEFPSDALRTVGLDVMSLDARYIIDLVVEDERGEFSPEQYFLGNYRRIFYPGKRTEKFGSERDDNGLRWDLELVGHMEASIEPDDDYGDDVTLYFPCRSLVPSGHNAMFYDAAYILELVEADYRKHGDRRADAIFKLRDLFY